MAARVAFVLALVGFAGTALGCRLSVTTDEDGTGVVTPTCTLTDCSTEDYEAILMPGFRVTYTNDHLSAGSLKVCGMVINQDEVACVMSGNDKECFDYYDTDAGCLAAGTKSTYAEAESFCGSIGGQVYSYDGRQGGLEALKSFIGDYEKDEKICFWLDLHNCGGEDYCWQKEDARKLDTTGITFWAPHQPDSDEQTATAWCNPSGGSGLVWDVAPKDPYYPLCLMPDHFCPKN